MVEDRTIAADPSWSEHDADEWADAITTAMKLGGVEHFFFVSGSEIGFYQEAVARAAAKGWPAPRLLTVTHEGSALNAALGSAMVREQPAATAAHVDVGTFNYGAGLHTAWRGSYPVLITAGAGPRAYPGSMRGARGNSVQWVQEPRDQGEIVRQYTKLDHRLEHSDNPGLIVSRLLQVAMSEPRGPVYMTVPQEAAMLRLPGKTRFPTRDELGVARPAWPDPSDAKRVAEWLVKAQNPVVILGQSGRNSASVAPLVRLAELLALPMTDSDRTMTMNFPTTHPLSGTGPSAAQADVVVVIETPVPYMPANAPKPGTKIIWVDPDPVQSRYKTMEFHADVWLPVLAGPFAEAVYEQATAMLTKADMGRIEERRERLAQRKEELRRQDEDAAMRVATRDPISPRWVGYQIGQMLEEQAIVLDDTLSSTAAFRPYHGRSLPGSYFKSGGSAGGWGTGAAFGAKTAAPDRDVVLVTGDGYFMFGSPLAALWSSGHYKTPFLTVVFVNRSYSTGTAGVDGAYPGGYAASAGYEGGLVRPSAGLRETGGGSERLRRIGYRPRRGRPRAQARAGGGAERLASRHRCATPNAA